MRYLTNPTPLYQDHHRAPSQHGVGRTVPFMEQTYLNGGAGLPYHLNVSADKNLLMATPGLGRYVQGRLFFQTLFLYHTWSVKNPALQNIKDLSSYLRVFFFLRVGLRCV